MGSVIEANRAYETWLRQHCAVVPGALKRKRERMAQSAFEFLRASCFRFAAQFPALLPELAAAPPAPSCGDAHVENFGTWRDAEGRLVWGVNDLDEAARLPFPCDLVRLATSALLVPGAPSGRTVAAAILKGYRARLASPGGFVLDEEHAALRAFAAPDATRRARFWARIDALNLAAPPGDWQAALLGAMPPGAGPAQFARREAGLGSLGRPRYVAIAAWRGGRVVREAKARLPSAWLVAGFPGAEALAAGHLAAAPTRVTDPWLRVHPGLVVRRLAPDSDRLPAPKGERALLRLLEAMGGDIANLHASGSEAASLGRALDALPTQWLRDAAWRMAAAVTADWKDFRKG